MMRKFEENRDRQESDTLAVQGFLAEVGYLARSVDPALAIILGQPLEQPLGGERWTRGRKSGLEFCLAMLGYARVEAQRHGNARQIDRAISHIVLELVRGHAEAGLGR